MSAATAEIPLTDQQRAALEAGDRSVSLAAGAGCGKTFVLTERFLRHADPTLADAAGLEQLVAITFTDAAAREMRDRIRRRCYERLQAASDPAEAAKWQRLMRSIDVARISTIHSFCTQLLRTHAVEAGLDPQFEVLDAAAAELLKLETVDERLRTLLLEGNADVLDLAAKRGLDRLRNDVAALAGPRAHGTIERWLDATPEELVARWREFYDEKVAPMALEQLRMAPALVELRRLCDPAHAQSAHLAQRLTELAGFIDALSTATPGNCGPLLEEIVKQARVPDIRAAKHWNNFDDYPPFKDACESVRELIKKCGLSDPPDFSTAHEAAAQGLALLRLVADVDYALEEEKTRRNQLDFDDLLARAHRLLTDPHHADIRQHAAETTRLLMVDEFQDTNPLQVSIIQAFCGDDWRERGLFAVGDFKQSIYRFNGAEPRVSLELREAIPAAGRLSLTRNFRSQPAITDFVNAVFEGAFPEYEPLVPARPQTTATPAVEFMWIPDEDEDRDGAGTADPRDRSANARRRGATHDARVREARWIARRLVQLLKSPEPIIVETIDGQPAPRPLKPGDVAILLRTLSDAQVYEEALRTHGLDYYLAGGHAFYSQQEIYDVLNLLRAVASNVDEIALAGALRSPLFSLADETLFWLVQNGNTLNAALAVEPPANITAEEAAKVRRAAATLAQLRVEKDRLLVADLFALAMELTGYDAVLLTEFLGPRKAANIEKLIEQARVLDRSSPGDLQGFITQLSEFVTRAPKEALAATQAEGDVIRIMTIHYAKGLEFPLVVLPDLDRQRHAGSSEPVLHEELGPLVPIEADEEQGSIGLDLYRRLEDLEDFEERQRLLYVAFTRAADYLLLSSSLADPAKPKRDWLQLIDQTIDLGDGALRRPLPAGYGTPQVRVTTELPEINEEAAAATRGADLNRLVIKTRALAAKSAGEVPAGVEPIPVDARARRRFSFSQLSGQLAIDPDDAEEAAPRAWVGDELQRALARSTGLELGALVHGVLERIDLKQPHDIREWCDFLAPQFAEVPWDRAAADAAGMVERFLRSPRGAELAAARIVRREVEFVLPWPAEDAMHGGRYLHGYIDCLYQDAAGRWRLLDYKTNRVAADRVQETAKRYELQLLVYALACERALGEPLAECSLQLLDPGAEHAFSWDEAARRRGEQKITAAMESLLSGELPRT